MGSHEEVKTGLTFWDVVTSAKGRKVQVAILGILLSAATGGLLPPDVAVWVILVINGLSAYGVYQVPNEPMNKPVEK